MKPIQLIMCGWGSYPGKSVVDFKRFYYDGLFLITGPTGGGKTTIFDAISFALYGNVSGKTREKTSVRSDFAPLDMDTYVELLFSHKGMEYKIRRSPRYLRPKKRGEGFTTSNETAELSIHHEAPIVNLSEVNSKMNEIMGVNYEQFKKIAMIAQGEFLELLISSSKDRVDILRNLFKTNQYEKIQHHLSDKSNTLFNEIEESRHKVEEGIHLIDTGDNDELKILCNTPNLNHDNIVETSKEYINYDKEILSSMNMELDMTDKNSKEKISLITQGEQLNSNIDRLNQITTHLEEKLKEEDKIKAKEKILQKALSAEKVRADERIYQDALKKQEGVLDKMNRLKETVRDLKPKVSLGMEEYKEAEKNESFIEELQNEYSRLEGYLPLTKDLIHFKNQVITLEEEMKSLKNKEEALGVLEEEKKQKREEQKKEFLSYEDLGTHIGEIHLLTQIGETKDQTYQEGIELIGKLTKAKDKHNISLEDYEKTSKEFSDFRYIYQLKEETYKNAIVGIVAKLVKKEEPCPVCGSLEHPNIARISEEVPDEAQMERLSIELEKKKELADRLYQKTIKQKTEVDTLVHQVEGILEKLKIPFESGQLIDKLSVLRDKKEENVSYIEGLKEQLTKLKSKRSRKLELRQEMDTLDGEIAEIQRKKEMNTQIYHEKKSKTDVLKGKVEQLTLRLSEGFPDVWGNELNIKEQILIQMNERKIKIQKLKDEIVKAKENYELLKAQLLSNQTLLENSEEESKGLKEEVDLKKQQFNYSLNKNKFKEEEEYKNATGFIHEIDNLSNEINEFYEEKSSLEKTKSALEEQIQNQPYVDIDALRRQLEELGEKEKKLRKEKEVLTSRINTNQKLINSIEIHLTKKEDLENEYGILKDLDNVTKGYNKERLVFEQYVLATYFEDIIMAANQRLSPMTNGRYELLKVDQVADARTTDSLNLEVLDNYTGKKRSVKTLSGGESFKAALALALGLSDIVQNNAGGIQIDTLFIDEGFGSLDTESLDQALDTLTSLTQHNRLIGIISHVNELKERIDNQIIVEKTNTGSKIKIGDGVF